MRKFNICPDFEKYHINKDGIIFDIEDNIILHPFIRDKCIYVNLKDEFSNTQTIALKEVVINTYIGKMEGYSIIHKNGEWDDCSIENLMYDISAYEWSLMIADTSIFKPIPRFSNYWITESGIIYNNITKRPIVINFDKKMYREVYILRDSTMKYYHTRIHRILAFVFIGNIDDMDVNHIDNKSWNNKLYNLEIISHRENARHYTMNFAQNKSGWTHEKIEELCGILEDNKLDIDEISKKFNFIEINKLKQTIYDLKRGKIWSDISCKYGISNFEMIRKLSSNDVVYIREYIKNGSSDAEIAKLFGVTGNMIGYIRNGKSWKNI